MDSHFLTATGALIRDTFREAMARKIFWGLFALSSFMLLFLLLILKIDLVEGAIATVSLFGQSSTREMDVNRIVRQAEAGIATFLYTWGMFLAVFASAGLVPSLLEPGRIELLLSKPVGRTHLLLGRYTGNLLVVLVNTLYLVGGAWIVLGWKTGIWRPDFLSAIASTMFLFAVLLSVVVLVGVAFESTALSVMVAMALMIVSPILAQHSTAVRLLSSEWARNVWMGIYYVLPKVYGVGKMTVDLIMQRKVEGFEPVWTSAMFGAAALGLAILIFRRRDF